MNGYNIIKIKNHPELISRAADWFHEKWYVPVEEYRNSMEASMQSGVSVPQWYLVVEDSRIIGGARSLCGRGLPLPWDRGRTASIYMQ